MNNKREFYRLSMFRNSEVSISHLNGEAKGAIIDISASGMAFESREDFELKTSKLSFELDKTLFTRDALFIRRKELQSGNILYAVEFFSFTEKERQHLFQTLIRIEAKRRNGGF